MKKFLILLLAVLMILPLFASCNGGGTNEPDGSKETDTQPTSTETASPEEAEREAITAHVKDVAAGVDFAGKEFTLIGKDEEPGNFPKNHRGGRRLLQAERR